MLNTGLQFIRARCTAFSQLIKNGGVGGEPLSVRYSAGLCTASTDSSRVTLGVSSASTSSHRGPCTISGWIKSARHQSKHSFLHLTDGLSDRHLQVVLPCDLLDGVQNLNYGACVKVSGDLVDSPAHGQKLELQATDIVLLGSIDTDSYPFAHRKKAYTAEYTRQFLHLRPKRPEFAAMLRLRNSCKRTICNYLHNNDFIQIDTPILTSNDCEGAGETFCVDVAHSLHKRGPYFGKDKRVNLTVSGQLHLETCSSGNH